MKNNSGFTLLEVIIYIALFSILIGSALFTAYQVITNSNKLSIKNTTEEEGNFVMQKFNWALSGIDPTISTTPSTLTSISSTLDVTKYNGNIIDIHRNGAKIEMKESLTNNTYLPITTDNVLVTNLQFSYITTQGSPSGITATTIINGVIFTITKYFRK